ncbi:hypothetical protein AVEN_105947-1 [Araneus ventricosus]|uniref:Uncharacterized protein n=1 Tax=Araneus ventricosus TaxID=182803 RepID=A0A4Y2DV23_ARAVE|nr:hypothetical protein AVEN_105947-1 [Araneus ventricosus]
MLLFQTFVVRYKNGEHTVPVTVVLDYKKQTEYVINMSPRAATKTVTLYDFKQKTIAYKDLTNRECFLGRLTYETLSEETDALTKIHSPVERQPKVLSLDPHRSSLTPTEIRNMAGQKTAVFCGKMNTWLVLPRETHTIQKREVDEIDERTFHRHGYHTVRYSHFGRETRRRYRNPASRQFSQRRTRYREDSSTFEIPYFVAKVAKFFAKVRGPDVAAAGHPILTPVKLSSQPEDSHCWEATFHVCNNMVLNEF